MRAGVPPCAPPPSAWGEGHKESFICTWRLLSHGGLLEGWEARGSVSAEDANPNAAVVSDLEA